MRLKSLMMISIYTSFMLSACQNTPEHYSGTNTEPDTRSYPSQINNSKSETSTYTSTPEVTKPEPKKNTYEPIKKPSSFSFPQSSCGDNAPREGNTWWRVYVNNGDLGYIRSQYCGNAFNTVRQDTGGRAIQVGSFTSLERAQELASEIGGEVSQPINISAKKEPAPKPVVKVTCPDNGKLVSQVSSDAVDCQYSAKFLSDKICMFGEYNYEEAEADIFWRQHTGEKAIKVNSSGNLECVPCVGLLLLESPIYNGVPLNCNGGSANGGDISEALIAFFDTEPKVVCVYEPPRNILWKCRMA